MIYELVFFITPLLSAALIHHGVVIPMNLMSFLTVPVDLHLTRKGRRLLGKNKSVRGIVVMALFTGISMAFMSMFIEFHLRTTPFAAGVLLGGAYAMAELPNSFAKRSLDIKEGARTGGVLGVVFFFVDHMDSVAGATLMLFVVYWPSWALCIVLFITGFFLHVVFDTLLHWFGYKKKRSTSSDGNA